MVIQAFYPPRIEGSNNRWMFSRAVARAIGGVNAKIEGFFEVCKAKGFTGNQEIIISESNVQNLMLKEGVVEAVKEGTFHIYPAKDHR
jgi:predicted ATP-dependent protease